MKEDSTTESESEIIERVLSGDRQAFSHLVSSYQEQVFSMIMKQVADRVIAEELAQETFIRAYKYLPTFKGNSKFSTWLTRIAINQSHSYFSSKRYKQKLKTKSIETNSVELQAVEESQEFSASQIEDLRIAISKLKPKYRDVITLVSFEGRSYKEVADILEIPTGTVGSRMNKALHLLRASFGGVA